MEEQKQSAEEEMVPMPLTQTQHYWWSQSVKNQERSSPHFTVVLRLHGVLDMVALERSVVELMERHHILRSVFRKVNGTPHCFCLANPPLPLYIEDLRGQIARVREENYHIIKDREITANFNLENGPLFRLLLICLGQGNWVLVACMHPILFDRWSVNIFFRELSHIYRASSKGESSPLEPLPMQFTQFALWQNERLKNNGLKDQWSYWREQLKGFIPPLDLPVDFPRQTHGDYVPEEFCLNLPNPFSEGLAQFCQNGGYDLFCVLLAAFKVLAARHAGQTDILVGTPFSGRNEAPRQYLIGPFLNTLALRTQTETSDGKSPTFLTYLEQVEAVVENARRHADLPFESLISQGLVEKDAFHIFFEMNGRTQPKAELTDLEITQFETFDIEPEYDMYLHIDAMEQIWKCSLVYNANLFRESRISEILNQFQQLLIRIIEDPHRPISSYSLLTKRAQSFSPTLLWHWALSGVVPFMSSLRIKWRRIGADWRWSPIGGLCPTVC